MRWIYEGVNDEVLALLSEKLKISDLLARLLIERGLGAPESAHKFLNPTLKDLENPSEIEYLDLAVERLQKAYVSSESIAVVSDYDVDGITSMALLARCFRHFKYTFSPFFPCREKEGYGLSEALVNRLLGEGKFTLLIALDCGTNSHASIDLLKKNGLEVIVIDHHQVNEGLKNQDAIIINPHVAPKKHSISAQQLCTVGLVFKLIHGWVKKLKQANYLPALNLRLSPFLDLVALGTIADMVPLRNENRIFVHYGLKELSNSKLPGVRSLLTISACETNAALNVEDVSFKLAPRINVSGRLSSADLPFRLLTESDPSHCRQWAVELNRLNQERQQLEKIICDQAEKCIKSKGSKSMAWVLYDKNWHVGVVGIVAGKLSKKYHKPIFVLGHKDPYAKGSGRSIEGINLVELFQEVNDLMHQWGGHPSAVGITLDPLQINELEQSLNSRLRRCFPEGLPDKTLPIAGRLNSHSFTLDLIDEIERLAPFGQGNPAPIFSINAIVLGKKPERFGRDGTHIRFLLKDFGHIPVIGWGMNEKAVPTQESIDIAVKITWNHWQNEKIPQMQLIDWKLSDKG